MKDDVGTKVRCSKLFVKIKPREKEKQKGRETCFLMTFNTY